MAKFGRADLHKLIIKELSPAVVGIYMARVLGTDIVFRHSCHGSGTCISFNGERTILTCEHVVSEMRKVLYDEPWWKPMVTLRHIPCWLGDIHPLTIDSRLDIAVLSAARVAPIFPYHGVEVPPFLVQKFPIPEPLVDETVYLIGFPKEGRAEQREDLVMFDAKVTGVSAGQCRLYPVSGRNVSHSTTRLLHQQSPLGGMSGSPGFVIRKKGIHLVGVFHEGGTADDCLFLNLTSVLKSDGSIDWPKVSPDFYNH